MVGRRRYEVVIGRRRGRRGWGDEGLQHGDDRGQTAFDVGIFSFDGLLGADDGLQFLVGLLGGEFPDPPLEILNGEFGPLSYGTLGLTVCVVGQSHTTWVSAWSPRVEKKKKKKEKKEKEEEKDDSIACTYRWHAF